MIWLRRILAVLLILLFPLVFLAALILIRVNDTLLSADFYVDQLRKADVYTFMYDEAGPAALKEASASNEKKRARNDSGALPMNIEKVGAKGLVVAREVLPPEWLEQQTEQVVRQVVPYAVGDRDSFAIAIPADRIEVLGKVLPRELGDEDTYNLIFDEVISPLLKDALDEGDGSLVWGVSVNSEDVVSAVKEVAPREWIQARLEHVADELVPYVTGKADHFAIEMPVSDRVAAAVPPTKRLLARSHVYEVLNSREFAQFLDKQVKGQGQSLFGVRLTGDQVATLIRGVVTPQWLQTRVETALDEVVPYATGQQAHFNVAVPLKDRIEAAAPATKQLLRDTHAYEALFDQVLVRMVETNVGQVKDLPLGITLTSGDISPLLKQALPPAFLQAQAERAVDQLVLYLTGDAQSFRLVVPLAEQKAPVITAVQDLVDRKLKEAAAKIPACTVQQAVDLVQKGFGGALPSCLPKGYSADEVARALGINVPGVSYEQIAAFLNIDVSLLRDGVTPDTIKKSLNIDVAGQVGQFIGTVIPNEFVFTDTDLRQALGPDNVKLLDKARDYGRNGFTFTDGNLREKLGSVGDSLDKALGYMRDVVRFTDEDLRSRLNASQRETLDKALKYTREGSTFTDADLRDLLAGDQGSEEALSQFDKVRDTLGTARPFKFALYLVPAMLLAAIGFLGGRRWRSRVAWAAAPLLLASGIAYVAFGPVYRFVAQPLMDEGFADAASDATGASLLMIEKGTAMARTAIDAFVSGLATRALILVVVSVVALALAILWPKLARLWRPGQPTGPQPPQGSS